MLIEAAEFVKSKQFILLHGLILEQNSLQITVVYWSVFNQSLQSAAEL